MTASRINRGKIETAVGQLLKALDADPDAALTWDLERDDGGPVGRCLTTVLPALQQGARRLGSIDYETIEEALNYALQTAPAPRQPRAVTDAFVAALEWAAVQWIAIYPLDYSSLFSDFAGFTRPVDLGPYWVLPPQPTADDLTRTLSTTYPVEAAGLAVYPRLFEHQVRAGRGYLARAPLLVYPVRGTEAAVSHERRPPYHTFRELHDLFVSEYPERSRLDNALRERNGHFFLLNPADGKLSRTPIWEGTRLLATFRPGLLEGFVAHGFAEYGSYLRTGAGKLVQRLTNALRFFSKAFNEDAPVNRLLFYVVAMEALFSRDKHTPLRVTLADSVSLLCYPAAERVGVHRAVRELYDVRSAVVHTGADAADRDAVAAAERFARRALLACLALATDPGATGGDEDRFFDALLRLKLTGALPSEPARVAELRRAAQGSADDASTVAIAEGPTPTASAS